MCWSLKIGGRGANRDPYRPKACIFSGKTSSNTKSIPEGGVKYAVLDPPRTGKNYFTLLIFKKIDDLSYLTDCVYRLETTEKCLDVACSKLIHHKVVQLHLENNVDNSLGELIKNVVWSSQGFLYP